MGDSDTLTIHCYQTSLQYNHLNCTDSIANAEYEKKGLSNINKASAMKLKNANLVKQVGCN